MENLFFWAASPNDILRALLSLSNDNCSIFFSQWSRTQILEFLIGQFPVVRMWQCRPIPHLTLIKLKVKLKLCLKCLKWEKILYNKTQFANINKREFNNNKSKKFYKKTKTVSTAEQLPSQLLSIWLRWNDQIAQKRIIIIQYSTWEISAVR